MPDIDKLEAYIRVNKPKQYAIGSTFTLYESEHRKWVKFMYFCLMLNCPKRLHKYRVTGITRTGLFIIPD